MTWRTEFERFRAEGGDRSRLYFADPEFVFAAIAAAAGCDCLAHRVLGAHRDFFGDAAPERPVRRRSARRAMLSF